MKDEKPTVDSALRKNSLPETEFAIQKLWQSALMCGRQLQTTDGKALTILHPGKLNRSNGPDFSDAIFILQGKMLKAAVEIHLKSSDWFAHRHHEDHRYNSVKLHVVWEHNQEICNSDGEVIYCLRLSEYESHLPIGKKQDFLKRKLSCQNLGDVYSPAFNDFLKEQVIKKLDEKVGLLDSLLKDCRGNYQELSYRWLMRAFGLSHNQDLMLELSQVISYQELKAKFRKQEEYELIWLKLCGFQDFESIKQPTLESYISLRPELRANCQQEEQFKTLGLRPSAGPVARFIYLGAMLHQHQNLLEPIYRSVNLEQLKAFYHIRVNEIWQGRYGINSSGYPGETHLKLMVINHALPILWFLYRATDDTRLQQLVFKILNELPAEQNHIIEIFKQEGIKADTAFQSQGLIYLYKNLCTKHLCNQCYVYQEKTEGLNQLEELGVLYQ